MRGPSSKQVECRGAQAKAGLRNSHLLPGALLDCPLLPWAQCCVLSLSHCDLVEMLLLFTCQSPDGAGSGTCQQSPLQVWAAVGLACAVPSCCVTLGSTCPFLVTRGLTHNPRLLTRGGVPSSLPLWVGKHSNSKACGILGSGGGG